MPNYYHSPVAGLLLTRSFRYRHVVQQDCGNCRAPCTSYFHIYQQTTTRVQQLLKDEMYRMPPGCTADGCCSSRTIPGSERHAAPGMSRCSSSIFRSINAQPPSRLKLLHNILGTGLRSRITIKGRRRQSVPRSSRAAHSCRSILSTDSHPSPPLVCSKTFGPVRQPQIPGLREKDPSVTHYWSIGQQPATMPHKRAVQTYSIRQTRESSK